jgi:hypothetical protein
MRRRWSRRNQLDAKAQRREGKETPEDKAWITVAVASQWKIPGRSFLLILCAFATLRDSMRRVSTILVVLAVAAALRAESLFANDAKLFDDQVASIFERRCLSCHNDGDRKGGLSLQSRKAMQAGGDSGEAVHPGKPETSLLFDAISGEEPEMPKDREPLSADEVAAIRKWIESGANWPEDRKLTDKNLADRNWWSLQSIERPPLPQLSDQDRAKANTPIDYFVLAKLHEHGLKMSPVGDRRTLARRLYFDLLGLPPTPEEIEAFLKDDSPTAYEELVDRLLASPGYGERWARHWLDVVKYADTCGYDKDKLRPNAWPYRDYVIRSFNEDKPYERFVREQIAGDVLFPGEPDGILGLGFIAAGPWDFIGHAEVPETKIDGRIARHIDRDEMVTNTFNTFCSVTIQCARCHNHKFDPYTQEHYYSLQTIFAAVDRADRQYDLDPEVDRRKNNLNDQLRRLQNELAQLEETIKKEGGDELATLEKRIAELRPKTNPKDKNPAFGYHSNIEPKPDREKWVQVDLGREVEISQIVLHACHDEYANIGSGFGFPVRFKVATSPNGKDNWTQIDDLTKQDVLNPGLVPYEIPTEAIAARFVRITATKLVERTNDFIFALSELEALDRDGKNLALRAKVTSLDSIEAPVRWARANLTDGIWPKGGDKVAEREFAEAQVRQRKILARIQTPERVAQREKLQQQIGETTKQIAGLPKGRMVYAAATQFTGRGSFKPTMGNPRTIKLLYRGNILTPGDEMPPATLPIIESVSPKFELSADHREGDRRAALARWLTRADHPLTWRSIVNRIWLYHFGRGIVETPNDLGRMGQLPSHPELLDWLAAEFRDNGQSIKDLHRLIVTSAVYRQASADDAEYRKIDGNNQYLWRMNRRRLEAEEIRDAILSVSGRMNTRMGGPGYYLFVLEKTDHSPHYEYYKFDPEDPTSHRRSVYRFIVRSQPDPFMTTLDCADSSQSTPKRNETLTSLQALSLLNNRFNLAMSKHFAARLQAEADDIAEQIDHAMQLAIGRSATLDERNSLEAYAKQHGIENLCRVLFNLSEFMYLD